MSHSKYYGCEDPKAASYLEFGSIDLEKDEKRVWNYWQDQDAYDFYMFARYSRDLFAFRKFFNEEEKTVETLNKYVVNSAHNKLMDYLFKYAGMIVVKEKGIVCECGSSLYGWIDEGLACDFVYRRGRNADKIKSFHYIGNDISELMNEGAANFHSDVKIDFLTKGTILEVVREIRKKFGKKLSLFYGLSVSVRYAVRDADDLIETAKSTELSLYNRLSMTYGNETLQAVYGTGKSVYIISLPKLVERIEEQGLYAKYYTKNMQYDKDGEYTVRASVIISADKNILEKFMVEYDKCIDQSIDIDGVEKGNWKNLDRLLSDR